MNPVLFVYIRKEELVVLYIALFAHYSHSVSHLHLQVVYPISFENFSCQFFVCKTLLVLQKIPTTLVPLEGSNECSCFYRVSLFACRSFGTVIVWALLQNKKFKCTVSELYDWTRIVSGLANTSHFCVGS